MRTLRSAFLLIAASCFRGVAAFSLLGPTISRVQHGGHHNRPRPTSLWLSSQDTASVSEDIKTSLDASSSAEEELDSSTWVKQALLISSFTDGILANPDAQAFLKYSLACTLLEERVRIAESAVRESVLASPCNGPDIDAFNSLETYDEQLQSGQTNEYNDANANRLLQSLAGDVTRTQIRLLYIPTAMYALNPNSNNTPGKQRQRARADGKKRRTQVAKYVQELAQPHLTDVDVLAITLDLDDGSLKQPTGSDDASDFPKDGMESLTTWAPHIVYVEGGNTFWLQHCLEKGNWQEPLKQTCVGPEATSLYIGKSAGAIIAGNTVETATWKGWDDPSVVAEKPSYEDWKGHRGLAMAGSTRSFFPHMSEDWETLVVEKRAEMEEGIEVVCLGEFDAYCIDGREQKLMLVSERKLPKDSYGDYNIQTRSAGKVVMKLDIEGSEFQVLPNLMFTGALCKGVDFAFGEGHSNFGHYFERPAIDPKTGRRAIKFGTENESQSATKYFLHGLVGDAFKSVHPNDCKTTLSFGDDASYLHDRIPFPTENETSSATNT